MYISNLLSSVSAYFMQCNKKKLVFTALLLLLLFSLALRIGAMYCMQASFLHNDGGDYLDISEQIAKGNGFTKTNILWYEATPPDYKGEPHTAFHRPPLLPLLGALFYLLPFDVLLSARIFMLVISVSCILMVYILAKELFSSTTTAFLAAALYSFYPYSIYHSSCYSSENLFLLFITGASYCILKGIRKDFSLSYATLSGAMLALATLTRPQGFGLFLLLGFTGTIVMLCKKELRKKLFKALSFYTLGAFLLLFPWMIRNYTVGGIPTPLTFYDSYSFAQASSDVSYMSYKYIDTPQYKEMTDKTWNSFHAQKKEILAQKNIYTLPEAAPCWKKWAWEYIRNNPGKMWFIVKSRILHCFRAVPNTAATGKTTLLLIRLYYIPFFLLFIAGIYFARKNKRALLLLLLPVSVVFFAIPFLMLLRYRYPFFAPVAAIFAAYAIVYLAKKSLHLIERRKKKRLSQADPT